MDEVKGTQRPVLVLSPHPDDESLGCGGTIRLLTTAGIPVHVLYVTRGELGTETPGSTTGADQALLAQTRSEEARQACQILGVAAVDFLDGRDTRVAEQPDLAAQLQRALESVRYQRVFCPWPQEQHPDHAATYVFYRQAVSRLSYPLDTWLYEVWTPLRPTMLVPIDAFIEEKLAAIRAHRSQLAQLDYAGAFRGLAAWRALACPPSRFAEAFCICDRDTLISGAGRGTAALAS